MVWSFNNKEEENYTAGVDLFQNQLQHMSGSIMTGNILEVLIFSNGVAFSLRFEMSVSKSCVPPKEPESSRQDQSYPALPPDRKRLDHYVWPKVCLSDVELQCLSASSSKIEVKLDHLYQG